MPIRPLTTTAARMTAALISALVAVTVSAAPAQAEPVDDTFLNTLDSIGLHYDDPAAAVDLGQSICPALTEPGANAASTAAKISGRDGISAALAGLFTSIAISTYCPQTMTSLADGKMPDLPLLRDLPGLQLLPTN